MWLQIKFTTKHRKFCYKFNPNHENFTPSRIVWMVTFCKSAILRLFLQNEGGKKILYSVLMWAWLEAAKDGWGLYIASVLYSSVMYIASQSGYNCYKREAISRKYETIHNLVWYITFILSPIFQTIVLIFYGAKIPHI